MSASFERIYDFSHPLDDVWEAMPDKDWTLDIAPGCFHMTNAGDSPAENYLRACHGYDETLEFQFAPGAARRGVFVFGFIGGFEYIVCQLDFASGDFSVRTQEFHKAQPRLVSKVPAEFHNLKLVHVRDSLPGLPYSGSRIRLFLDGNEAAAVGEIDFLPESLSKFGLKGKGEFTLSRFAISGAARPRPEYVNVGIWQQLGKPTTPENVDGLLAGVRQAAEAGVQILATPETSLTGLRDTHPDLSDRAAIQSELRRFQEGIANIPNAPYTLVGYPDWVPGNEVEGATLPEVKVNCHRFVRPDGGLGPHMAKVHSCEEGLWHGRNYNLQRVAGVEVAVGICHDGHYQDVWALGVMAGARLCIHAAAGGSPNRKGNIDEMAKSAAGNGGPLDSFWVRVNSSGGSGIYYPLTNRKHPNPIVALPRDLTPESPTYPDYSFIDSCLAHARIRLWDATGCYPLRTLRSGKRRYELWSELMPSIQEV